ncbi:MAG: hypothetical protein V8S42_09245 [Lachnospiraceae bacterium]
MNKFEEKIDITYSMGIIRKLSGIVDNELTDGSSASDAEHRAADFLAFEMKDFDSRM